MIDNIKGRLSLVLRNIILSTVTLYGGTFVHAQNNLEVGLMSSATVLIDSPLFVAHRRGRYLVVNLQQPHRVLSTSSINGGQVDDLKYLVNFQSMEAVDHETRFQEIIKASHEQYHEQVANALSLPAKQMGLMGTAANINHLAHVRKQFKELTVDALVTAGVKGNALRAGDAANWYQTQAGNQFVKDKGTINVFLLINQPLTAGAQAKSVAVLTEAKSAALIELAVASKQSPHLATGTGTDQYFIAAPYGPNGPKPLASASGHLKLGELIGQAVREAVIEALRLQNGLERSNTRTVHYALSRFGLTAELLLQKLQDQLPKSSFVLLQKNQKALTSDPKLVASAFAYAAILDRIQYGTLSSNITRDVLQDQAAITAVSVSGRPDLWHKFRRQIEINDDDRMSSFIQAIALGWQAKWMGH